MHKPAPTEYSIHELLTLRWSPRAFDRNRPVPREHLLALIEAARWAPSCYGDEPWRYLVWDRFRDEASWNKAFDCLGETNRKWVKNVPVLMLSCPSGAFERNGKPNRWAQHDTGAASVSLALEAVNLGLAVHQMGGFDAEKIRAAFAIPAEFTPMAMIAVGYQAQADILEDAGQKERELAARARKPRETRFFESAWGTPVTLR
ncbi:MAG: nitroreductase family protein [Betaproteobacteria bacterium]|nr:nitroreductase family protein [Betaproteobacteria bacterium]